MFSLAPWKFRLAGLRVLEIVIYVLSAPFVLGMTVWGIYFIVIAFAWIVLVDAAFVMAILVFEANFLMAFAIPFNNHILTSMGDMWVWIWSWFSEGNVALWPHIAKSFPPYLLYGIVCVVLFQLTFFIKNKANKMRRASLAI